MRSRVATAIRLAIQEIKPDLAQRNIPVSRINWGWCEEIAERAGVHTQRMNLRTMVLRDGHELCSSTHELWLDSGWTHAWLWVEGRHYDSEAPFGVSHWLHLPHFKRWLRRDTLEDKAQPDYFDMGNVDIVPVRIPGEERSWLFRSKRFEMILRKKLGLSCGTTSG